MNEPTFSIIMPTRDRPMDLVRAVKSVLAQDYPMWQLVVQECTAGAGTELPVDERIVHQVGMDRNISHGLNLALARATGEILHYACDDDELLPTTLSVVADEIGDAMWLRGAVEFFDAEGTHLFVAGQEPWDVRRLKRFRMFLPQPGIFWRRAATDAIGTFDESVPLASDYDYWIRLADRWEPRSIDAVLAHKVDHRGSISRLQRKRQIDETRAIQRRYHAGRLAGLDLALDSFIVRTAARWTQVKAPLRRLLRRT